MLTVPVCLAVHDSHQLAPRARVTVEIVSMLLFEDRSSFVPFFQLQAYGLVKGLRLDQSNLCMSLDIAAMWTWLSGACSFFCSDESVEIRVTATAFNMVWFWHCFRLAALANRRSRQWMKARSHGTAAKALPNGAIYPWKRVSTGVRALEQMAESRHKWTSIDIGGLRRVGFPSRKSWVRVPSPAPSRFLACKSRKHTAKRLDLRLRFSC